MHAETLYVYLYQKFVLSVQFAWKINCGNVFFFGGNIIKQRSMWNTTKIGDWMALDLICTLFVNFLILLYISMQQNVTYFFLFLCATFSIYNVNNTFCVFVYVYSNNVYKWQWFRNSSMENNWFCRLLYKRSDSQCLNALRDRIWILFSSLFVLNIQFSIFISYA